MEDENSDFEWVALYNYDKIKSFNSYVDLDQVFVPGKYILIFEPYYKVCLSLTPGIRVDDPNDIMLFDNIASFHDYYEECSNGSAETFKIRGNNYF